MKPTLAKKLNDRIIALTHQVEVLKGDTKVDELERKVQVCPYTSLLGLRQIRRPSRLYLTASHHLLHATMMLIAAGRGAEAILCHQELHVEIWTLGH